mmetsp:Transcript_22231/g.33960  ORF Transcript_22231/g.33960 Transcript_22231/m.33960 type:complete len:164 (-) Transcript_22231:849-1340(-)
MAKNTCTRRLKNIIGCSTTQTLEEEHQHRFRYVERVFVLFIYFASLITFSYSCSLTHLISSHLIPKTKYQGMKKEKKIQYDENNKIIRQNMKEPETTEAAKKRLNISTSAVENKRTRSSWSSDQLNVLYYAIKNYSKYDKAFNGLQSIILDNFWVFCNHFCFH